MWTLRLQGHAKKLAVGCRGGWASDAGASAGLPAGTKRACSDKRGAWDVEHWRII